MRRLLIALPVLCVALVAAFFALLVVKRHDLVYEYYKGPVDPVSIPGLREVALPRDDGSALPVWVIPPEPGQPVVVFFMGSGGVLALDGPRFSELQAEGLGVLAMGYRGGGGVPGEPTEARLVADAVLLWNHARDLVGPEPPLFLHGYSLGSGIAVHLATRIEADGLILEAPFTTVCEAFEAHHAILPYCLIIYDERYPNVELMPQVDEPLLVLHGDADHVVPIEQGRAVFDAHAGPKAMNVYEGAGHGDLRAAGMLADMIAFMADPVGYGG